MVRKLLLTVFFAALTLSASAQYNIKKLMEEGRMSLNAGFYVASMQVFDRVVALRPDNYEAWYLNALSKYHLEDYTGAEADCRRALALQPFLADIFELQGMILIRERKYEEAVDAYTHAIELNVDNRDYWFNRAYCYYMAGHAQLAKEQLAYVAKRWSNFAEARRLQREVEEGRKPKENLPTTLTRQTLKTYGNIPSFSKKQSE